jgi:hypothetical protein
VLQTIQVLTDPSDIGSLDTLCRMVGTRLEQGLEALFEFDAHRVVETSEFSLGLLLQAPVKRHVLSEPSPTEPGIGLEFHDVVLGAGDPAVELLDGGLPVGDPVPLGPSFGPCG